MDLNLRIGATNIRYKHIWLTISQQMRAFVTIQIKGFRHLFKMKSSGSIFSQSIKIILIFRK